MLTALRAMLIALVLACASSGPSLAADEMLVRENLDFQSCHRSVAATLVSLAVPPERVRVEIDTGALYRVRIVSLDANLIFLCNSVSGQISITRSTPGEWKLADSKSK